MANIVKARNSSFIDFDYIFENKSDAASGDVNKAIGGDVLINTTGERINTAMWDTGDTTLGAGEYFTQSTQAGTSGEYYLDVFKDSHQQKLYILNMLLYWKIRILQIQTLNLTYLVLQILYTSLI